MPFDGAFNEVRLSTRVSLDLTPSRIDTGVPFGYSVRRFVSAVVVDRPCVIGPPSYLPWRLILGINLPSTTFQNKIQIDEKSPFKQRSFGGI